MRERENLLGHLILWKNVSRALPGDIVFLLLSQGDAHTCQYRGRRRRKLLCSSQNCVNGSSRGETQQEREREDPMPCVIRTNVFSSSSSFEWQVRLKKRKAGNLRNLHAISTQKELSPPLSCPPPPSAPDIIREREKSSLCVHYDRTHIKECPGETINWLFLVVSLPFSHGSFINEPKGEGHTWVQEAQQWCWPLLAEAEHLRLNWRKGKERLWDLFFFFLPFLPSHFSRPFDPPSSKSITSILRHT